MTSVPRLFSKDVSPLFRFVTSCLMEVASGGQACDVLRDGSEGIFSAAFQRGPLRGNASGVVTSDISIFRSVIANEDSKVIDDTATENRGSRNRK